MTNDLARWQFATTSIYHFLFVPVTIGLAFLVAILQTAWHRGGNEDCRRLMSREEYRDLTEDRVIRSVPRKALPPDVVWLPVA